MKRLLLLFALFGAAVLFDGGIRSLRAQALQPQETLQFLQTLAPRTAPAGPAAIAPPAEPARLSMTRDGYLRYVGAPPGQHFPLAVGAPPAAADVLARNFMLQHSRLFGVQGPDTDFRVARNRPGNGRSYVRMQQLHRNIPVVAAEVVVQVDNQSGVESVLCDLATDAPLLGTNLIAVVPTLTADEAAARARAAFPSAGSSAIATSIPELAVFAPSVLDEPGDPVLVWDLQVTSETVIAANARVLVNALNGDVLRVWTMIYPALNRQIYDANSTTNDPGTLTRSEGQGPSGITDVNNAYDYLGDTYNFYFTVHGRDSLNNAGLVLSGTVRYCQPSGTNTPAFCPPPGLAFYSGTRQRMYFGTGITADDVTAHELTHGVTGFESGLIYTNASGAINESFSDVWGEFVDLTNGKGNDTNTVRWLIGEDIPGGAIRNMSNPPAFSNPDRLFSPLYQQPSITNDFGGVHNNSGVNNKLCCLLVDGNTFNGQIVSAMGINPVAALYYEVQVNLLTSAAGWTELYNALTQAAINLGWITTDRNNLYRACQAVEIAGPPTDIWVDKNVSCAFFAGTPFCTFNFGPFPTVTQGISAGHPGDVIRIRTGNYIETMTITKILTLQAENGPVTIGQ